MYRGAPMKPVRIDRGISAADSVRASVSMTSMKIPPTTAETGSRRVLSGPAMRRPMWGTTRPTQPTVPEMQTAHPVSAVEQTIVVRRVQRRDTPRDLAC